MTPDRALPAFLLGATAFLSLLLFTPLCASVFLPGDVTVYLLNAARMLQGQTIYRDFFQFTPPGTELVYLTIFRLFGLRAWVPNAMLLLLGLSMTWLSIAISRKVMRGWAVFLPGLLFLTCSHYNGLDATHHWYSILVVMTALLIVIEKRTLARVATVGALCGLAAFFTLGRGLAAVVGFGVFLAWEHRRKSQTWLTLLKVEACLAAAFLLTVVASDAYFVWKVGLARILDCTVIFGLRYYPTYASANTVKVYLFSPPPLRPWYGLPFLLIYVFVHILIPLVYLLFFVRYRRQARVHPDYPWEALMALNITGLSLFIGTAPAPSFFRLCVVSLPALILFVWFLSQPGSIERVLANLAWAFAILMVVLEPIKVQRHARCYIDLPSGRTAFLRPIVYDRYKWISEHTRPSEPFFEGVWADTYVALSLHNPTPVPYVTNTDYTRPEQVQAVVKSLERTGVRLVLWSLELDTPQGKIEGDHLGPLRVFLRSRYHMVKTFADGDQVWERKE